MLVAMEHSVRPTKCISFTKKPFPSTTTNSSQQHGIIYSHQQETHHLLIQQEHCNISNTNIKTQCVSRLLWLRQFRSRGVGKACVGRWNEGRCLHISDSQGALAMLLLALLSCLLQEKPESALWRHLATTVGPVFQLPVALQARCSSVSISGAECDSGGENYSNINSVCS
jgi:hypothetical protein